MILSNSEPPIPESEKKYYKPDEYYTDYVILPTCDLNGNFAQRKVVTFDERKKTSTVSRNGLYIAEILLLDYCSRGDYPHPKNGYPAFWWFEYGIRNVGAKLQSLEKRGFINMATPIESIYNLTSPQLKEILTVFNLPINGKKSDLLQRIQDNLNDSNLSDYISECKYTLTDLGKNELSENGYITYIHKNKGICLTVWDINSQLSKGTAWQDIIWEELKKQCLKYEKKDYGLYRCVRLDMAIFLEEEQRYYDAMMLFLEVVFWDLTFCNSVDYLLNDSREKNKLFKYEKSKIVVAPVVIKKIAKCQKKLKINDEELKKVFLENISNFSAPIQIFTYEEIVDIIFLERDKNVTELKKVYANAKKRFC